MTMKLEKIRAEIAETEKHLAGLVKSDGDVDAIARGSAIAREKISILKEREAAELQRLADVERADRDKRRGAFLKRTWKSIAADLATDNQHTQAFVNAIQAAVKEAVALHALYEWCPQKFDTALADGLITAAEHSQLNAARGNTCRPPNSADCYPIVKAALADYPEPVQDSIRRLFAPPSHGAPAEQPPEARKSVPLLDTVRALEGTPYPADEQLQDADPMPTDAPATSGIEIDLRSGNVIETHPLRPTGGDVRQPASDKPASLPPGSFDPDTGYLVTNEKPKPVHHVVER